MKKLLFRCALMLLVIGSILYIGGLAYKQTNTYRNLERNEGTEKFKNVPEEINVAVFGLSHGRDAFITGPETGTFFNFSMSSQTPQYDEKMMLQYSEHFEDETLVILTVGFISPFWEETEESFMSKQPRYYRILDAENIVDVDIARYWLQKFSPMLTEDIQQAVSALVGNVALVEDPIEKALYHCTSAEAMESERERILRNHLSLIDNTYPETSKIQWDAYNRMLTMCVKNDWKAVLVTPPYLAEYSECFPEEFYETYIEIMEGLAAQYNVPYLDYSQDDAYIHDYTLFKNIDHLNAYGAEKFEARFYEDLKGLGLL